MSVRIWTEPALIQSANEGKNELAKLLRHTREDYFMMTATGTISAPAAGTAAEITLPTDFAEFKDIEATTPGFANLVWSPLDRTDPIFRDRVVSPPILTDGMAVYYDIVARATMQLAGITSALAYRLYYIQLVPDMVLHTDTPSAIPQEHWNFIVNWVVTDALRAVNDPRYGAFFDKLKMQSELVVNAAQQRRVAADPKFARAFDED